MTMIDEDVYQVFSGMDTHTHTFSIHGQPLTIAKANEVTDLTNNIRMRLMFTLNETSDH